LSIPSWLAIILITALVISGAALRASGHHHNLQQIPAGGWNATPTFFEASSDADRRKAILVWFESIKYESWEANNRRDGVYPIGSMGEIRRYAAPWFEGIFGKPFLELSKGEKKLIVKWLKKCSVETWVTYGLVQPVLRQNLIRL
jgi:hypothetical protein